MNNRGIALLLTRSDEGNKKMNVDNRNAGSVFAAVTGGRRETQTLVNDESDFFVNGRIRSQVITPPFESI